jgi:nicotinamide-nucleotide adenylyltransferase
MILILGRFQPLHRGHMKVIGDAYAEDKALVIAIGSAQKSDESNNPFSGEERQAMLENALKAEKIRARLVLVPDIAADKTYVSHVERFIRGRPDRIITENTWTIALFRKEGYDVHITPRYFGISATEVRRRMACGERWTDMVPKEVADVIKRVKGIERVRNLLS